MEERWRKREWGEPVRVREGKLHILAGKILLISCFLWRNATLYSWSSSAFTIAEEIITEALFDETNFQIGQYLTKNNKTIIWAQSYNCQADISLLRFSKATRCLATQAPGILRHRNNFNGIYNKRAKSNLRFTTLTKKTLIKRFSLWWWGMCNMGVMH